MERLPERLRNKITTDANGCWLWTGSRYRNGYGQTWNGERPEQAHRVIFRLLRGAIPDGTEIDHLCRVRNCVNPAHLETVPHRTNMRRSETVMGENARKTQCKRGHEFDDHNTRVTPTGARQCRKCVAMHARNAKRRRRDAQAA